MSRDSQPVQGPEGGFPGAATAFFEQARSATQNGAVTRTAPREQLRENQPLTLIRENDRTALPVVG